MFLLLWVFLSTSVFADYQIKRYSVNSASGPTLQTAIQSSRFEIKGNAGQVDASGFMHGEEYRLNGGFWHENRDLIFKDNLD